MLLSLGSCFLYRNIPHSHPNDEEAHVRLSEEQTFTSIIRLANVWQDQAEEALFHGGGWGGAGGEDESAMQRAFQNHEGGKEGAGRRERDSTEDSRS